MRGDEPVQVRRERERRQAEQEFEVVSAGEADDRHGGERGDGELGKSIAGDCGVHGPNYRRARRRGQ